MYFNQPLAVLAACSGAALALPNALPEADSGTALYVPDLSTALARREADADAEAEADAGAASGVYDMNELFARDAAPVPDPLLPLIGKLFSGLFKIGSRAHKLHKTTHKVSRMNPGQPQQQQQQQKQKKSRRSLADEIVQLHRLARRDADADAAALPEPLFPLLGKFFSTLMGGMGSKRNRRSLDASDAGMLQELTRRSLLEDDLLRDSLYRRHAAATADPEVDADFDFEF